MARQVALIDNLRALGHPVERPATVLETFNELMACYIAHRERITKELNPPAAS